MKIKHYLSLVFIFLILLGCQNIMTEPEADMIDIPKPPIEKLGPNQKPLSEVMDNQLYTWKLTPEKTIYVVSVNETGNPAGTNDATAFFGDIALYIGEDNKGIAHLQAEIPEVRLDLADSFLDQMAIGDDTFIGWLEPSDNDQYQLALWHITDNQLTEVKFKDYKTLETSEPFLKVIEKEYLQTTLAIQQTETNEYPVRMYQTFEWDSNEATFAEIAKVHYEEEKLNTGEILHLLWLTDPNFYFDYGQHELDVREIEMMAEGKLILDEFYLGQAMQNAIHLKGEPLTTFKRDYTEEYRYQDGFTYVFDLNNQALMEIKIRGTAVDNSLEFFEQEFAEREDVTSIELDTLETPQEIAYQIGEYQLFIELNDHQEITAIRLKNDA